MATNKKKELGSIKRVGTRYGRTTRHKVALVEYETKMSTKCPYCSKDSIKRISAGIWHCNKCNSKFTSGAYSIKK